MGLHTVELDSGVDAQASAEDEMERRAKAPTTKHGFVRNPRPSCPFRHLRLLDAFQRLQMARNNEQPPGSLRLARRKQSLHTNTKPAAPVQSKVSHWLSSRKKVLLLSSHHSAGGCSSTSQPCVRMGAYSRGAYRRVSIDLQQWSDGQCPSSSSALPRANSPRYERKRLPSLDGSTDSGNVSLTVCVPWRPTSCPSSVRVRSSSNSKIDGALQRVTSPCAQKMYDFCLFLV